LHNLVQASGPHFTGHKPCGGIPHTSTHYSASLTCPFTRHSNPAPCFINYSRLCFKTLSSFHLLLYAHTGLYFRVSPPFPFCSRNTPRWENESSLHLEPRGILWVWDGRLNLNISSRLSACPNHLRHPATFPPHYQSHPTSLSALFHYDSVSISVRAAKTLTRTHPTPQKLRCRTQQVGRSESLIHATARRAPCLDCNGGWCQGRLQTVRADVCRGRG